MCGIVGYLGGLDAVPVLLDCLRRLEYRGYDSAGIGVIHDGELEVRRCAGKIANLERLLLKDPIQGLIGVAHTRWATHGKPSDENAHPQCDCSRSVAVVHNGIIENCLSLRATLEADGHVFKSETDTEIVAHLIEQAAADSLEAATLEAVSALRGAYALGVISRRAPETLIAVRNGGAPLVIGLAKDGLFLASDIPAILDYTRDVLLLEDGEMAILSKSGSRIITLDGRPVRKEMTRVRLEKTAVEKNGYPHFMLKEINEQPRVIEETTQRLVSESVEVVLPEAQFARSELRQVSRLLIIACGTSWHAGLVGKYMLERFCRIPVEVEIASEFRYREPVVDPTTLVIAITQSGETADTLGALREAKARGARTLSICNVPGSSASRESDGVIYTRAGLEIGVASTKAFSGQLVALYLFAVHLGMVKGAVSPQQGQAALRELLELPLLAERVLDRHDTLKELASRVHGFPHFLYLGRGINYPIALEGALKLKEISYIHAEGYAAGEMKHGPIALIDRSMPVVVIAPRDRSYDKILGNIEEVKARDGRVIVVATDGDEQIAGKTDDIITVPPASELLLPILLVIPLQLLAYHVALLRQCDVDQPRNLAKSVTVE